MKVVFWGTRGSLPTPLSAQALRRKLEEVLRAALRAGLSQPERVPEFLDGLAFWRRSTFGGNTATAATGTSRRPSSASRRRPISP